LAIERLTRLDMHFSCALALYLAKHPTVKQNLLYFPNTSIYAIGDELRYVEYQYEQGNRVHQISAVERSDYLQVLLKEAKSGISYGKLVEVLTSMTHAEAEAVRFVEELIEAQLLVSDLEPAITAGDFGEQILSVLKRIFGQTNDSEIGQLADELTNIQRKLKALDHAKINDIEAYLSIIEGIKRLVVDFEENKLFQTDLFRPPASSALSAKWQHEMAAALEVLNRISSATIDSKSTLQGFAERFYNRYETQEIPLLEALDPEIGVGYLEGQASAFTPLVEGLQLPSKEADINLPWNKTQQWSFQKLQGALAQNKYTVSIEDPELQAFPAADWEKVGLSFSVMFRLITNESHQKQLLIENAGGVSAIPLLGRFAQGQTTLLKTVCEIAATEQERNPDVIFAEIIHLPESRTGNILLHPVFRAYEIPFLGKSSLPVAQQIDLQDLYVLIQHGQVILRSKRLNKRVIPRLSNAHNFSQNALPVYQFLCDLQRQGKRTRFGLDWGIWADKYPFLPRVTYQNTILKPAIWQLTKEQINAILTSKSLSSIPDFTNKRVVLADGDNELLVDWQNPWSVLAFRDAIKNRDTIQLKEFLYEPVAPTFREKASNKGYLHQCIALVVRQTPAYISPLHQSKPSVVPQRSFSIGSEWLYFKLYGGVKVADKILVTAIKPLCKELFTKGLIDKWFFIRYADPDAHIRLRFHLTDTQKIGEVIGLANAYLEPALAARYLWKIQTDTYQRELERYGATTMEDSEFLFCHHSEAVLTFLAQQESHDTREALRWLWGAKAINELLDDFGFELSEKLSLLQQLKESFAAEFQMDTSLKQQLDKRYRLYRSALEATLAESQENLTSQKETIAKIRCLIPTSLSKASLLGSYIHLLLNRLIPAQQRLHELVVYDFLYRYYVSCLLRTSIS